MPCPYLPPEVWQQIASLHCCHCIRDSSHGAILNGHLHAIFCHSSSPLYTLARLCCVSRLFKDIATPVLYHAPITKKPAMLLRTLLERPDLARHVRELQDGMWNDWNSVQRDEYPPPFLKLYEDNVKRLPELTPGGWDPEDLIDPDEPENYVLDDQVLDSTAIALCPNLTALHVRSTYLQVCITVAPDALTRLTSAAVVHEMAEHPVVSDTVTHLVSVAPNLTALHLRTIRTWPDQDVTYPLLPCVTDLTLDDSLITGSSWPALLASCPQLTSLSYTAGTEPVGSEEFAIGEIQDALIQHASRLKRLVFDMSKLEVFDPDNLDSADRIWGSSLLQLPNLEYFATDVGSLVPLESNTDEKDNDPEERLVRILPSSLRCFALICIQGSPGALEKALEALMTAIPDEFPKLKRVILAGRKIEDADYSILETALKEVGGKLEVKGESALHLAGYESSPPKALFSVS